MGSRVRKVHFIVPYVYLIVSLQSFRWYYTYKEEHLQACTMNIHAMLLIPAYIRCCRPAWTTWAFPMERFCGKLSSRVTSRLHPYATLSMYLKRSAQLSQLKMSYQRVWTHLSTDLDDGALTATEFIYHECQCRFSLRYQND